MMMKLATRRSGPLKCRFGQNWLQATTLTPRCLGISRITTGESSVESLMYLFSAKCQ
ncbi:hypothetical protein HAX54_019154, partial [Datura stramonium]|nr:hypothetical protein [Datura stramonium]